MNAEIIIILIRKYIEGFKTYKYTYVVLKSSKSGIYFEHALGKKKKSQPNFWFIFFPCEMLKC